MPVKSTYSRLNTCFFFVLPLLAVLLTGNASIGSEPDSGAIINFYNPPGSLVVTNDPAIAVNENEMRAGLLYDMENKKVVWQKQLSTSYPIASLTKMMVALITVEDINAGRVKWSDNVSWKRNVVVGKRKKRHIVSENLSYSLHDLFKAAMIASNNEAAEQIARYLGGEVQVFVDRMNTRARELGMNSTYFGNPTGLPASAKTYDNSSTPADLLILALEMLQYDEIMQVTGLGYADINNGRSTSVIRNHNHLTIDYKGEVDGMKTGYTRRAGFCLVATSNKCDHRLISVVLGSRSPGLRNEVVKDMFNDYYSSIGLDKLGPYCNAPSYATASPDPSAKTQKSIHVVRHGEDLASVAYQYNCSVEEIKSWNHLRYSKVKPGQKIVIVSYVSEDQAAAGDEEMTEEVNETPAVDVAEKTAPIVKKTKVKAKPAIDNSKYIIYIVQPGDTLFSIARQYAVSSVAKLKAANRLGNRSTIKVGARLKVPVNS